MYIFVHNGYFCLIIDQILFYLLKDTLLLCPAWWTYHTIYQLFCPVHLNLPASTFQYRYDLHKYIQIENEEWADFIELNLEKQSNT
ncbi:Uncharacterised protein [Sphingobacterium multivorum]|nr:Uncharacterised protein [Sphingobacterium multivorum]